MYSSKLTKFLKTVLKKFFTFVHTIIVMTIKVEDILKTKRPISEKKKLMINLMLTTNEAASKMAEALKPFELSIQQFNVLRILRGQGDKPANLCTVQDRMVSKMSNTTRLVDKLLEKKLVDRNTCEENRRKIEIYITQKGLDLLKQIDPIVEKTEEEFVKDLSLEDVKNLNSFLEKLRV